MSLGILCLSTALIMSVGCSDNDQNKSANPGVAVPNSAPKYIVVRVANNNRNVDYAMTQTNPQNSEFNQLPWQNVNNQTLINENSGFPTNTYDANIFFIQNNQADQDQSVYGANDIQYGNNNYGHNGGHHGRHHGQHHGNFYGYYNYPNYYGYSGYHYAHYYPSNYYSYYYSYNYLPAYYYNYAYWYYTPVTTYYTNPYYRYYLYQLWW